MKRREHASERKRHAENRRIMDNSEDHGKLEFSSISVHHGAGKRNTFMFRVYSKKAGGVGVLLKYVRRMKAGERERQRERETERETERDTERDTD